MQRDPHLAPGREDVDGAVVVGVEVGAVRTRRHCELLDLFAQCGNVLARLTQRRRKLLVLGHRLRQLALGLEQALLERPHALGCVLQAAPQDHDLLFEALDHLLQLVNLSFVLGQPSLVLRGHERPPPRSMATLVLHSGLTARIRYVPESSEPGMDFSRLGVINYLVGTLMCSLSVDFLHSKVRTLMKVWIDQDLCTGDGLCEEIAPAVFTLLDDGLAYVKESDKVFSIRAAPRASRTSPTACSTRLSSPPRSAPASASSSRLNSRQFD